MNKKTKLFMGIFAVLVLAIATIGTVAYFTKSFSSDNNTATAASFDVDVVNADGQTINDGDFNLDGKLFPGMDLTEVYSFQVKKVKADVPIEYKVNLTPAGDLFPANTDPPIILIMQRNINDVWVEVDHAKEFDLVNDTDSFRILVSWPHGDNDIDFQGKTGNVKLEVVVSQANQATNRITGNLVKTTAGEAEGEAAKTIVSYKFEEGYAPNMSNFKFYIYDGDAYVNEWFGSSTQKVGPVPSPRTGVEVAEVIVNSIYVSQRVAFLPLTEKWDVTSVGSEVIFTSKADKAYDNFQIVVPEKDNRAEIQGEFLKKQAGSAGHAGVNQVNTLTVGGTVGKSGSLVITFDDGSDRTEKTISIAKDDTHASIASKIAQVFSVLSGWDVTNSSGSASVIFTF